MPSIEPRQWGLILVIVGTGLMAISVTYRQSLPRQLQREMERRQDVVVPTQVIFCRWLFWSGLGCIALGSLMQW